MTRNSIELCESDLVEEILRGNEVDAMTGLQRSHAKGDRKVRLPTPGGTSNTTLSARSTNAVVCKALMSLPSSEGCASNSNKSRLFITGKCAGFVRTTMLHS